MAKPSTRSLAAIALALLLPSTALAGAYDPNLNVDPSVDDCSVRFAPDLTQGAFRRFAREFGSVSAFKQASPPTTLGRWRFAVDVEQIFFRVEEKSAAWNDTFTHPNAYHPLGSDMSFPKLRVRMGVTDDLDVGAYYTANFEANYGWLGVEAKYRILEQRDAMPVALAVRGAYTKTLYVADMDMHALTADVSVGRTFWRVLTPYLGVGADAVLARETSPAVNLKTEAPVVPHLAGGFEVRFWHVAVGAEAQLAALNTFQAQVSAVF
jgi:opacity protein-like surface antigen